MVLSQRKTSLTLDELDNAVMEHMGSRWSMFITPWDLYHLVDVLREGPIGGYLWFIDAPTKRRDMFREVIIHPFSHCRHCRFFPHSTLKCPSYPLCGRNCCHHIRTSVNTTYSIKPGRANAIRELAEADASYYMALWHATRQSSSTLEDPHYALLCKKVHDLEQAATKLNAMPKFEIFKQAGASVALVADEECAICLDQIVRNDSDDAPNGLILSCGHVFHRECIRQGPCPYRCQ